MNANQKKITQQVRGSPSGMKNVMSLTVSQMYETIYQKEWEEKGAGLSNFKNKQGL